MFETNQNKPARILRFLISLVLLPAPFVMEQNTYTLIAAGVGVEEATLRLVVLLRSP